MRKLNGFFERLGILVCLGMMTTHVNAGNAIYNDACRQSCADFNMCAGDGNPAHPRVIRSCIGTARANANRIIDSSPHPKRLFLERLNAIESGLNGTNGDATHVEINALDCDDTCLRDR